MAREIREPGDGVAHGVWVVRAALAWHFLRARHPAFHPTLAFVARLEPPPCLA